MVVGPSSVTPSMPARTQRNPPYLDHVDCLWQRLAAIGKRSHDTDAVQERGRRHGERLHWFARFRLHDDVIENLFVRVFGAQQHKATE